MAVANPADVLWRVMRRDPSKDLGRMLEVLGEDGAGLVKQPVEQAW